MPDEEGYLHVSWNHHASPLSYARGVEPLSLTLTDKMAMTGKFERQVTYPEFYKLADGTLCFMYRDGGSGNGNMLMNSYSTETKQWTQVMSNLISGEGARNAYWQTCLDKKGVIHISWVWRESPDVMTNHDMCYAKSEDGGMTWKKSTGEIYALPITQASAEYCTRIPQRSDLINQTAMATDDDGNPYIATYYKSAASGMPQYHVIHKAKGKWEIMDLGLRSKPFSLSGAGTKRVPISRPQLLAQGKGTGASLALIFRDAERGSKVSMAVCRDLASNQWSISDLTDFSVGLWEPSYDTELWRNRGRLSIFVQETEQIDGGGKAVRGATRVHVLDVDKLEW